jgi:hypothetical protein
MICVRWKSLLICLFVSANILGGCGGGSGGGTTMPATPAFTSTPVTAAEEGVMYSYQVTATSSDMSAITYELSGGPAGATLSGNTVTWTPTHAESRAGNAFTVKAMTAAGGSATQTWNVTPNGTVNVTQVFTFWGPNGSTNLPVVLPAGLSPGPQLFFPQPDGTLVKYAGIANPDGSVSFSNVPAGYYWLEPRPVNFYWTSASDFDNGQNLIGNPLSSVTPAVTTTFDYSLSGLVPAPPGVLVTSRTDGLNLGEVPLLLAALGNSTTLTGTSSFQSFLDYTKIDTLYFLEYELVSTGGFQWTALGPEGQLSNLSLVNGGTNNLTVMLNPSPLASMNLSIKGSAWANAMQGIGPGTATPLFSNYAVVAQPYLTNGFVPVSPDTPSVGAFQLLQPFGIGRGIGVGYPGVACGGIGFPSSILGGSGLPPIVTDVDYGELTYGDPFPAEWPRLFQYCQASTVSLPRPNSNVTDTFTVGNRQTTTLPSGPVSPMLTPVQNPIINGASLFQATNLNTTSVNLSWGTPATGQPYGYYVRVFLLSTLQPGGTVQYLQTVQFATAKTAIQVPFLTAGNTYVFVISAEMDPNANIETSPGRTKAPNAEASVVSAPIVIAAGATAAGRR